MKNLTPRDMEEGMKKIISIDSIQSKEDLPCVPILLDVVQDGEPPLKVPEIRVWCHNTSGDDEYKTFDTFKDALDFIASDTGKQLGCEDQPLIAFRGFEINIWGLPQTVKMVNMNIRRSNVLKRRVRRITDGMIERISPDLRDDARRHMRWLTELLEIFLDYKATP